MNNKQKDNLEQQRLKRIARQIHNEDYPKEESGFNMWHLSEKELKAKEEKTRLEIEEQGLNPEQKLERQLQREIKRIIE